MSETAAPTTPVAARPLGRPRGVAFVILISLITFGIYFIYWNYKTGDEIKKYSGEGLGGILWLVIALVAGFVMWFVAPSEVGNNLYKKEGMEPPVSGKTGFWMLIPLIGFIIWVVKVQGALNRFWESKGAIS
jgi:uncharacterized protein DUF4234